MASVAWKVLGPKLVTFASLKAPRKLHTSANALVKTKLELKPFWKIRAILNNVDLKLRCSPKEDYFIDCPDGRQEGLNISYNQDIQEAIIQLVDNYLSDVTISLPYLTDLDVALTGSGSATIYDVENKAVDIEAQNYDVELGKIESNRIRVVTESGDLTCAKTLKGNTDLETHAGDISAQKIQGNFITLMAENGSIRAGDMYAEQLRASSRSVALFKSLHGKSHIQSEGFVGLGTGEGDITLLSETGDLSLHLADTAGAVEARTESGNVELSYSCELSGEFYIFVKDIDDSGADLVRCQGPDNCLAYKTSRSHGSTVVTVRAPAGEGTLRCSNWLDAISKFNRM